MPSNIQVAQQQILQWNLSLIKRLGLEIKQRKLQKTKRNVRHVAIALKKVTLRDMIITNQVHINMIAQRLVKIMTEQE